MHKIGVIGVGFVGMAVSTGLQSIAEVREYDKYKDTESLYDVVNNSDILFMCLPTPMEEDGACNTSIIESVAAEIDRAAESRKIIILKSTVPPGTTQSLADKWSNHGWMFSPEFLTERNFLLDFINQDRAFFGLTKQVLHTEVEKVESLFEDFIDHDIKLTSENIRFCESHEAEMLKYVTNCFLAVKVTFFNEMKEIADELNVDYDRVIELLKLDSRIGQSHLNVPGPDGKRGFGGSCFPKDLNALKALAYELGMDPMVLETVWTKNLLVREEYEWEDLAQVTGDYHDV